MKEPFELTSCVSELRRFDPGKVERFEFSASEDVRLHSLTFSDPGIVLCGVIVGVRSKVFKTMSVQQLDIVPIYPGVNVFVDGLNTTNRIVEARLSWVFWM